MQQFANICTNLKFQKKQKRKKKQVKQGCDSAIAVSESRSCSSVWFFFHHFPDLEMEGHALGQPEDNVLLVLWRHYFHDRNALDLNARATIRHRYRRLHLPKFHAHRRLPHRGFLQNARRSAADFLARLVFGWGFNRYST